jgi:hypothetical protein
LTAQSPHRVPVSADEPAAAPCRACGLPLRHTFVDLGLSPLCESFVPRSQVDAGEMFLPLHVLLCDGCYLAQLKEYVAPENIFTEYAYFSSYSQTLLDHAAAYARAVAARFGLGPGSTVVEVASNDGYLLRNFRGMGIPVLGIEPAANVAAAAEAIGVRTLVRFFNTTTARDLARDGVGADLLIGNNVLAQVPALNGFVAGFKVLLKPRGVATLEFPHLVRLVEGNQFDTIYHEHFSYFLLSTTEQLFARHGLTVFDVDEIPIHGGSLRLYVRHTENPALPVTDRVVDVRGSETDRGATTLGYYASFRHRVEKIRRDTLRFLIDARERGQSVVGYGAPGKGNTFLNYCGVRSDLLEYTVDRNPYKHDRLLPGSRIPIFPPERINQTKPEYVFILPWNLRDEIMAQNSFIRKWGGRFVVAIPSLTIID